MSIGEFGGVGPSFEVRARGGPHEAPAHLGRGAGRVAAAPPSSPEWLEELRLIGITHDDALLYVADADHDRVRWWTALARGGGHVPVGGTPERVLVGPDAVQ
jgi:hypothetical protein